MLTQPIPICLALLILTAQTLAQCSGPDSQSCSAANAVDVVDADLDATEANDGLRELFAAAGVGDPGEKRRFFRRQDTGESLCCSPETECLSITGIPYCYDTATTEFTFANGSYGFLSNQSFYSADGSNLNDSNGDDTRAESSTETSFPAASAAAPTSPLASSSGLGTNSAEATPTGVANASQSPLASGTLAGKGAKSEGQSTSSASASIESTSGTSSVARPTITSNSAYQAGGQNGAAAAGFAVAWIVCIFPLY